MRFLLLDDYALRPGLLTEWVPVTTDFGGWHSDPRHTSHNHEQHLRDAVDYRERTNRDGGRESWLGLAIEFDGALSIPSLRAALTAWVDHHEVLRSHVLVDDDGTLHRRTTDVGTIDFTVNKVGSYPETAPLVEQIVGAFDRSTAPLRWPAYQFATVARDDDFTLLLAADHSLVDGYSLILAEHELRQLYLAALDRADDRESLELSLPETGSYVDYSAVERDWADAATPDHPAVRVWEKFRRIDGALADDADQMPALPQRSFCARLLDATQADDFARAATAAGGSVFTGMLGVMAIVNRDVCGDKIFHCVIPKHTRTQEQWQRSLGWFVATTPFKLDCSHRDTASAIAGAADALTQTREGAALPFNRIGELLGGGVTRPTFVVSFIDTRRAPGGDTSDSDDTGPGTAAALRSHSYATDEVYVWINRTPSGIRLSARFPAVGALATEAHDFLTALGPALDEFSRTGSISPL